MFWTVTLADTSYPRVCGRQVALPILIVDYGYPTHLLHPPSTHNFIATEDSRHWIPPTPYNPRYENCNSVLMPRRRVSSSFFDSSSLPDLSTSLSVAVSGGSASPTMQTNAPDHLMDEEEPVGVDEGKREEDPEDYEELRSWLDCVATSGEVARMRRADRLAPRALEDGFEGLEGITGARKGSRSMSWYQGTWPPAAASSTCAPEVQENVLPGEVTSTRTEQREESRLLSDHSKFVASSTPAELQSPTLPSTSETATSEAEINPIPALLFEGFSMGTGDYKPDPYSSPHLSSALIRKPLIRSSFATSHSNTVVSEKQKPVFVMGFKHKASKSFRKFLEVFGLRHKPTTTQSRGI